MAQLIKDIMINGKIGREDAVTVAQRLDRAGMTRCRGIDVVVPETFLQFDAIRRVLNTGVVW